MNKHPMETSFGYTRQHWTNSIKPYTHTLAVRFIDHPHGVNTHTHTSAQTNMIPSLSPGRRHDTLCRFGCTTNVHPPPPLASSRPTIALRHKRNCTHNMYGRHSKAPRNIYTHPGRMMRMMLTHIHLHIHTHIIKTSHWRRAHARICALSTEKL